jgi:phosphoribosylanthranilate isomerase
MFGKARGGGVQIKICGITNQPDALAAIECGADALGFNLYPGSKRYIDIKAAARWIEKLSGDICKVAVMVNPAAADALRIGHLPFIDGLQLHGQESPAFCQKLADAGIHFAKAVLVKDAQSIVDLPSFHTSTIVLDSAAESAFGGSGKKFPWDLAQRFIDANPALKVILAGGLTVENVAKAISEVRPFGVDVTTGIERAPGQKDHLRLQAFVHSVHSCRF